MLRPQCRLSPRITSHGQATLFVRCLVSWIKPWFVYKQFINLNSSERIDTLVFSCVTMKAKWRRNMLQISWSVAFLYQEGTFSAASIMLMWWQKGNIYSPKVKRQYRVIFSRTTGINQNNKVLQCNIDMIPNTCPLLRCWRKLWFPWKCFLNYNKNPEIYRFTNEISLEIPKTEVAAFTNKDYLWSQLGKIITCPERCGMKLLSMLGLMLIHVNKGAKERRHVPDTVRTKLYFVVVFFIKLNMFPRCKFGP